MTNTEIINGLKALRTIHNGNYAPYVDGAIKLLSAEPCEDCVDRAEILKHQYRIDDSATLSTRDVVDVEDIEDLLPVKPKSKTGHWIEFVANRQHKIKCDKCNYIEPKYITHIRNFCPNCGIKMLLTIRKGYAIARIRK